MDIDVWHKFYTGMYLLWDAIDSKTRTKEEAGHKPLHAPKQCFTKIKLIMTTGEKELLLKDLSARLPYGVKCEANHYGCRHAARVIGVYNLGVKVNIPGTSVIKEITITAVKPFLFPLSSMTEEQKDEYLKSCSNIYNEEDDKYTTIDTLKSFDWFNAHHFDYRGLIVKGLALDATGLNIY